MGVADKTEAGEFRGMNLGGVPIPEDQILQSRGCVSEGVSNPKHHELSLNQPRKQYVTWLFCCLYPLNHEFEGSQGVCTYLALYVRYIQTHS